MNHYDKEIEYIVGHLEDIQFDGTKITGKPVFDPETSKYKEVMGYIRSRFNAGDIPNVSIGAYGNRILEKDDDGNDRMTARNLEPDHLGIVVHGACNPETGCGIGLQNCECGNCSVTISDSDYVAKKDEYEKLKLKIKIEKIKMEEEND
jgi:hypothetical protein